MLLCENVTFRVGNRTLLEDVSLKIKPGTLLTLVGPNGAGKSTLIKVLCGDVQPSGGRVVLDGQELGTYSKKALSMKRAVMPQETLLSFGFSAEDVVMMGRYPLIANKVRNRDDRAVVDGAIQRTETTRFRKQMFRTLSGGEKARVTLARVLAQESPVVFLDEPLASLDPRHQHLVMAIAREVADKGGVVLAVLHDLNLASMYADEIMLLSGGKVRACGPPNTVLTTAILEEVFDTPFEVTRHPRGPRPLVLSLPS